MGYLWESIIKTLRTNIAILKKKPEESTDIQPSFVSSAIPKLKYGYLHKHFKTAVVENYNPIKNDIVVFRAVSANISNEDFVPMTIDHINGMEKPEKIDIDRRSVSFYDTIEGCELMAVQKYEKDILKLGSARAEQWRDEHLYIVQVTLKNTDGYVDGFSPTGHLNFAPFKSFNFQNNIDTTTMRRINYASPYTELGVLQGSDRKKYVTLFYKGNYEYCIEVIKETSDDTIQIPQLSSNDVLRYIDGYISIKKLAKKKKIVITSDLKIYGRISKSYDIDSQRVKVLIAGHKKEEDSFFEKLLNKLRTI